MGGTCKHQIESRIANRRDELPGIAAMVERFGAEHALPEPSINDVNVALDEVLSNIISYGYGVGETSEILVRLDYRPGEVLVEVEDAGKPFDPLKVPPPDLGRSLETRKVGGLGIHFIRTLMDEVAYERTGGRNRLKLTKRLPGA